MVLETIALVFVVVLFFAGIRIIQQYERGVKFRLGKYVGMLEPGFNWIIPIIERVEIVDIRVITLDVPKQQAITKDNVPVSVDGVVFFQVEKPETSILKVQNYAYSIMEYAQTALRDTMGEFTLDEILAERQKIGQKIAEIVDKRAEQWGLNVLDVRLQDIDMPEDLKRLMSRQASSEREKRANIIKSEGDKIAAVNLAAAAKTMAQSHGAMQLRTLQTIDGLGPSPSNTVILTVPMDLVEVARAFIDSKSKKEEDGKKK